MREEGKDGRKVRTIGFKFEERHTFLNPTKHAVQSCPRSVNITRPQECMSWLAAKAGYDSIQFLQNAPQTCDKVHANMNYEIVGVRLQGKSYTRT